MSINCEIRNNYNKDLCYNLNPDKIDDFLDKYDIDIFFECEYPSLYLAR